MRKLITLGTLVNFTSTVNGQTYAGIVCGYPEGEDMYEVAHGGQIWRMMKKDFTVKHGPCDLEISELEAEIKNLRALLAKASEEKS